MWPFKKKVKVEAREKPLSLYGYDLSKWNYLGYDQSSYADYDVIIHYFESVDGKSRSYHCVCLNETSLKLWKTSGKVTLSELWRTFQNPLYQSAYKWQSPYLKEYMKKNYGSEWSKEKNWWVQTEAAKYEGAVLNSTPTANNDPVIETSENNVITVKFKKELDNSTVKV